MDDQKWTIHSEIEVPLVVLAPDWRSALVLGLQLLELEHRVQHLKLRTTATGAWATDTIYGITLRVIGPPTPALAMAA